MLTTIPLISTLLTIGFVIIHLVFAIGVYQTAKRTLEQTWLVSPAIWACAALLLGPYLAAIYWLIHHSSIGGKDTFKLEQIRARRSPSDS